MVKQHHSGQKLRSASRWDQFVGMAMSQISDRQSLRDIQSNLESQRHKVWGRIRVKMGISDNTFAGTPTPNIRVFPIAISDKP